MRVFFVLAVLLSAVAARRDSGGPWRDEKLDPQLDEFKDGVGASGGELPEWPERRDWPEWESGHPVWPQEMGKPPVRGASGSGCHPGGAAEALNRDKRAARRPSSWPDHPGRGRRPHRGRPSNRPPILDRVVFSPIFTADNVTFQNTSSVLLKEGENVFVLPKPGGRGRHHHHHHRGGKHEPPKIQYVKLHYNTSEPDVVSVEYGLLQPNLGGLLGGEDNPDGF